MGWKKIAKPLNGTYVNLSIRGVYAKLMDVKLYRLL